MRGSSVVALPWFRRADYPALSRLFTDPEKLPGTFDAWLQRAKAVEAQFKKTGFTVTRVLIQPTPFAAWCKKRRVSPDQRARFAYVNQVSRQNDPLL
jgi:hypothetical protein